MNRNTLIAMTLILAGLPALHAADPVVTDVVAAQRPGTKLVDITFKVSDADSDPLSITAKIADGVDASLTVPATGLSGDLRIDATPVPTSYSIVWDAGVDFNQQITTTMVVHVIADDHAALGPAPPGMALVPAGPFFMGRWGSGEDDELPRHEVYVSAFYIDKFEVTKGLWEEVRKRAIAFGYEDLPEGMGQGDDHPAHSVNWYAAVKWCNARSEVEGLTPAYHSGPADSAPIYRNGVLDIETAWTDWAANGYRLPTEAEWEKAARPGPGSTYPWGGTISTNDANFANSGDPFESNYHKEAYAVQTTPVGFYDGRQYFRYPDRANGLGLCDVAGNVWEWCGDWYDSGFYAQSPPRDPAGPGAGASMRVVRGGSWDDSATETRCANRHANHPGFVNERVGFRTVRGR